MTMHSPCNTHAEPVSRLCGIDIWPGVILSVSSSGFFPAMIRRALGKAYNRFTGQPRQQCPTHTAIIVQYRGKLWAGDAQPPVCTLTPLESYEEAIKTGRRWNLQLFVPARLDKVSQLKAAAYWVRNIKGAPYDIPAFGRLALKAVFGDVCQKAAGLEWARWCTEGVQEAYLKGAGVDVFQNRNPTPVTVIKRWTEGRLQELSA